MVLKRDFAVVRMGNILSKPRMSQLRDVDDERMLVCIGGAKSIEVSKYLLLCRAEEFLGFMGGQLSNTFWTAGLNGTHYISCNRLVYYSCFLYHFNKMSEAKQCPASCCRIFKQSVFRASALCNLQMIESIHDLLVHGLRC